MEKHGKDGWNGLPAITRAGGDLGGGLCATGDREGSNVSGAPAEAGGIPRVRSGIHSGLASNK